VEENASLKFKPIPLPDYFPERPGSSVARTLLPPSFDGRRLRGKVTITIFVTFSKNTLHLDPCK
jgi:hypothetical protein